LFERSVKSNKNLAGVIFELVTKGEVVKSHQQDYRDWSEANDGKGGTYWDQYVCMGLGKISHFKQTENRWSASPAMIQLRAFWVSPNALESMLF